MNSRSSLSAPGSKMLFDNLLACVWGGGDLGSGVAYRLFRAGYPVVILELPQPSVIRRAVSFAQAVYDGSTKIDGVKARRVEHAADAIALARSGVIAVLVEPEGDSLPRLKPSILIDARMLKDNPGDISLSLAPLVVALGPGYTAGADCHAVVETNRGHDLGRVIWEGKAEKNTGVPGKVGTHQADRVLRAPASGKIKSIAQIGDRVAAGQTIATVGGRPLLAPFNGALRGLAHDGLLVSAGKKIGDVDPRGVRRNCFTISDKALAIGGGVLEAIFSWPQIRSQILDLRATFR